MNYNFNQLLQLSKKKTKFIIGLMSGTSLDGLDIALCKFEGAGMNTKIEIIHFETIAYHQFFKENVQAIFSKKLVDLEKVCLMNAWIGSQHAQMINECLLKWNIKNEEIDIIASHGQSIYHAPKHLHQIPEFGNATLQIGDGDHIAVKTGILTMSDFRQKHIAAGGEGAPLAVYGDYILFCKKNENRVMLNIGGVANFTFLPGNLNANEMFSTDTGPGNTIMDAYVQQYFEGISYDKDATIAKQGIINNELLFELEENEFFSASFPKTTGPELFNIDYLKNALKRSNKLHLSKYDVMATLNKFTANTITNAIRKSMSNDDFVVYSSGGGMHNPLLIQHLQNDFPNTHFKTTNDLDIHPDAKEAVLFAVLANEALCGGGTNFGKGIPNVSMGKISFPK
jgi:anhydro-N-acetylmuramic acid kinase